MRKASETVEALRKRLITKDGYNFAFKILSCEAALKDDCYLTLCHEILAEIYSEVAEWRRLGRLDDFNLSKITKPQQLAKVCLTGYKKSTLMSGRGNRIATAVSYQHRNCCDK